MKNQSSTTQVTIVLLLFCLLSTSFIDNPTYIKEIETWHKERMESLKSEDGWLNLAGLIWLEVGKNTFGSSGKNKVVFPKGKSEQFLGDLTLQNGEVFLNVNPKAQIFSKNLPVKQIRVFPYEKPNEPTVLAHQSLRWLIIKRGDKFAVRLRDLENTNVKEFKGVDTFPIDENWRVEAKLEPATDKKIPITDVLGVTNLQSSPGTLVFKINGQEYRLDAVDGGKSLFIIFADKTNKHETYGAGRFLYANMPDANGITFLDFNKATNPPCAFTPYATCPLPPKQNTLPIAITAGEKNYGEH